VTYVHIDRDVIGIELLEARQLAARLTERLRRRDETIGEQNKRIEALELSLAASNDVLRMREKTIGELRVSLDALEDSVYEMTADTQSSV